jgi:hypothetical protein
MSRFPSSQGLPRAEHPDDDLMEAIRHARRERPERTIERGTADSDARIAGEFGPGKAYQDAGTAHCQAG